MNASPHFFAFMLTAANLVAFILFAIAIDHFGIHHHWVLAWVGALLAGEALGLSRARHGAYAILRGNLLWTTAISAAIALGRFQTIFACIDSCHYKLAAMLALCAIAFWILHLSARREPI